MTHTHPIQEVYAGFSYNNIESALIDGFQQDIAKNELALDILPIATVEPAPFLKFIKSSPIILFFFLIFVMLRSLGDDSIFDYSIFLFLGIFLVGPIVIKAADNSLKKRQHQMTLQLTASTAISQETILLLDTILEQFSFTKNESDIWVLTNNNSTLISATYSSIEPDSLSLLFTGSLETLSLFHPLLEVILTDLTNAPMSGNKDSKVANDNDAELSGSNEISETQTESVFVTYNIKIPPSSNPEYRKLQRRNRLLMIAVYTLIIPLYLIIFLSLSVIGEDFSWKTFLPTILPTMSFFIVPFTIMGLFFAFRSRMFIRRLYWDRSIALSVHDTNNVLLSEYILKQKLQPLFESKYLNFQVHPGKYGSFFSWNPFTLGSNGYVTIAVPRKYFHKVKQRVLSLVGETISFDEIPGEESAKIRAMDMQNHQEMEKMTNDMFSVFSSKQFGFMRVFMVLALIFILLLMMSNFLPPLAPDQKQQYMEQYKLFEISQEGGSFNQTFPIEGLNFVYYRLRVELPGDPAHYADGKIQMGDIVDLEFHFQESSLGWNGYRQEKWVAQDSSFHIELNGTADFTFVIYSGQDHPLNNSFDFQFKPFVILVLLVLQQSFLNVINRREETLFDIEEEVELVDSPFTTSLLRLSGATILGHLIFVGLLYLIDLADHSLVLQFKHMEGWGDYTLSLWGLYFICVFVAGSIVIQHFQLQMHGIRRIVLFSIQFLINLGLLFLFFPISAKLLIFGFL